jgi:hypothetical protein
VAEKKHLTAEVAEKGRAEDAKKGNIEDIGTKGV